uniref:T9SS type A sorting domain-containing protein n=1 Tax=candidate division WOR-3 bacterium TaxID=2052148 RepID=A0A7V0Z5Z0_UNCW3
MAKVFADDVKLNYTGTQPYLTFIKSKVYDTGGNNNGRLDPGETANITVFLKNVGGVNLNNLNTVLSTTSPYITVTDNSGYFGTIMIDSTKENLSDPYVVNVSSSTPMGHNAQFCVIATQGSFVDTFFFNLVVGSYHYLVWNPDPTATPGQTMHNILTNLGYSGLYSTTLPTTDLGVYRAILVCVGIYPNNYVIGASSPEATALVNYTNSGGRLYLEGGDVWYYDPQVGGYNFCPLFGISATADGTSDLGPIQGQTGKFTNQMYFNYAGENNYMDHISPSGTGAFLIFTDVDQVYDCGVARDAGTYRTVGMDFELGALVDGSGVSTRAALLDSILHFFGIFQLPVYEENAQKDIKNISFEISPNPFKEKTIIRFMIQDTKYTMQDINLKIYDASGRMVRDFSRLTVNSERSTIIWDGTDDAGLRVPSGVYFVHIDSGAKKHTEKVIKIE